MICTEQTNNGIDEGYELTGIINEQHITSEANTSHVKITFTSDYVGSRSGFEIAVEFIDAGETRVYKILIHNCHTFESFDFQKFTLFGS